MQTYFWLLSLLESWDFYRCSCYHTFEVISPRISKKSLLSSSTECIKGIYNPFCRDFARTLDIGRRKSSLSKNGLFTVCCYKNAYKYNITYILTYFTLRTGKTMKLQKNVLTKNLVSQKLSNPSLNELKFKKNAIQNGLKHTNHGMIYNVWQRNYANCHTNDLQNINQFSLQSTGVKLFIFG